MDEARSSVDKSALENVQKFAGRVITGKMEGTVPHPTRRTKLVAINHQTENTETEIIRSMLQHRLIVYAYPPIFQPSSSPRSKPFFLKNYRSLIFVLPCMPHCIYVHTTNNKVDTHLSVINTNYEVERCISPEDDFEVFVFHERTLCSKNVP